MLSRLYDERVFTSSDDVVFSSSMRRTAPGKAAHKGASSRLPTMLQDKGKEEEEEEEDEDADDEIESDDGEIDDEDDGEEDDDAEARDGDVSDEQDEDELAVDNEVEELRRAGMKFPLQSPRHLAAAETLLHRRRSHHLEVHGDEEEKEEPSRRQHKRSNYAANPVASETERPPLIAPS
ncbi:hypothetical protein ATCC90586_005860 [Pythium insidiosum]|nr:hypothetical protein ATCC90586_005860 [Pythium insidiosum]